MKYFFWLPPVGCWLLTVAVGADRSAIGDHDRHSAIQPISIQQFSSPLPSSS
jgi:hypothetical protein